MNLVVFQNGGYSFKGVFESFDEDNQHNLLFDYAAKDLSKLPALLEQYISKKMDILTFELNNYQYTENDCIEIEEILINLHAYYRETRIEVFIEMIGDYLDYLLIKANSHEKHPNIPEINKYTWDYDENKKYKEMFKMLIPRLKDNEYHFNKTPYNQVNLSRSTFKLNRVLENRYINYINRMETCKGICKHDAKEFIYVMRTQEIVKHMLFWIFDLSAPIINKLTVSQRTWLYKYIYGDDLGQFSKGVIKHLFSSTLSQGSANDENDNDNLESHTNLHELLYNFHTAPENITHNTEKALISAVNYMQGLPKSGFHEMYSINNLEQLLFLEILSMVNSNISIKRCKNCSKYFIVANLNVEYCNRIAQGEEKPCQMIGSKRTFEKKLKSEKPLEIYNRAYKTHYARRKTGKMKECEFMLWAKEAKNNLDKVRAGELDISEFEKWLKI